MTPRENMKRALEFRGPERLPVNGYGETSDTAWIGAAQIKPPQAQDDPTLDQWLCQWHKTDQPNMGQVRGHPLEDLARLEDYPWPDGTDARRFEHIPAALDALDADPASAGKYRITSIFMLLWERMHTLHGFENCMIDLMDDTPAIHELADRLVQYDIDIIQGVYNVAGNRIDAFNFSEDWGTQIDLHISPQLWTRFFLPRYKKIFGAARDCGWHVWMHSCGKVNRIIPGLIEAGLTLINLQQPTALGIEEIGRQFAGRITFETLCDIQKTLPRGDRAEITAQARQLMTTWGTPAGGFVLGDYGDHKAIGAQPQTKQFMLDTFLRLDPWKHGWPQAATV